MNQSDFESTVRQYFEAIGVPTTRLLVHAAGEHYGSEGWSTLDGRLSPSNPVQVHYSPDSWVVKIWFDTLDYVVRGSGPTLEEAHHKALRWVDSVVLEWEIRASLLRQEFNQRKLPR